MNNDTHRVIGARSGSETVGIGTEPERFPNGTGHSLSEIMGWFKSRSMHDYILGVETGGWPRFRGKRWQTGYYEHIVRTERALERIRTYIEANPDEWERDENYAP